MIQTDALISLYKDCLLNNVIPFWINKSGDEKFGGYFSCLDQQGEIFDTDKFIWLQCRQVWCFSMLYNLVEQKEEWLSFAIQGASFLEQHGRDKNGNWYFSLTEKECRLHNHIIFFQIALLAWLSDNFIKQQEIKNMPRLQ